MASGKGGRGVRWKGEEEVVVERWRKTGRRERVGRVK